VDSTDALPGVLTPEQVADLLGVDYRTILRMIRRGELAAFRVGPQWRITSETLRELMAAS
jgi:excisionase family DNA binding protein